LADTVVVAAGRKGSVEYAGLVGVMGISISSEEESVDTDIELMGVLSAESGLRAEVGVDGMKHGRTCLTKRFPVRYHCTVDVDAFE